MGLWPVSNIVKSPILQDEVSIVHVQSFLHLAQFDQPDEYIPVEFKMNWKTCAKTSKNLKMIYFWIIWWIKLNDPIDSWNV